MTFTPITTAIKDKLDAVDASMIAIARSLTSQVEATTLILEKLHSMEARLTRMIDRLDKMDTGVRTVGDANDWVLGENGKWRPK